MTKTLKALKMIMNQPVSAELLLQILKNWVSFICHPIKTVKRYIALYRLSKAIETTIANKINSGEIPTVSIDEFFSDGTAT